jgi:hypothetical protein
LAYCSFWLPLPPPHPALAKVANDMRSTSGPSARLRLKTSGIGPSPPIKKASFFTAAAEVPDVVIVTVAVCGPLDKVMSAGVAEQPMVLTTSAGVHVIATLPVKPEGGARDSGKPAEPPLATVAVVLLPFASVRVRPGAEDPSEGLVRFTAVRRKLLVSPSDLDKEQD